MRLEIARHKPPRGPFDIKLAPGGLIDLEFAVHTLQLVHRRGLVPSLADAIEALVRDGLLPAKIAAAHILLTRMLVTLRLVAPHSGEPPPASTPLVARACGVDGWEELLAAYADARQSISELWAMVAKAS